MALAPLLEGDHVRHHQGGGVLAALADDDDLLHEAGALDGVLQKLRRDILAAGGLEHLLLAVGDAQESVFDDADVPSVEPAVLDDLVGLLLVLVVAHHDLVALDEDLTVLGDVDLGVGDYLAHRADPEHARLLRGAHGDHGRGFGQAVALPDRDAGAVEEVRQAGCQRGGTAGHRHNLGQAEGLLDLVEDQLAGDAELPLVEGAVLPVGLPLEGEPHGPVEDG